MRLTWTLSRWLVLFGIAAGVAFGLLVWFMTWQFEQAMQAAAENTADQEALSVQLTHSLAWMRWQAWIGAAAVALAGLMAGAIFARRVNRPLSELAAAARAVAAGEYEQRVALAGPRELAPLADAFNQMCSRLEVQLAELAGDQKQLRAVFGSMVEGVVAIDQRRRITLINNAATRLLRLAPADALGQPLYELVRHRGLTDLVENVLRQGTSELREIEWGGADYQVLAVHATRLPGDPNLGAVLVFHDVSELRRLERHRQEFVANVSHELKTPLAAIQATIETLLDGAVHDPEHAARFLKRIHENTLRLSQLVQDLLSLGRIESRDEAVELGPVDVAAAAEQCLSRHEQRARGRGLQLELAPPAGHVRAWADGEALAHILDNLVDNAIKYTPAGGNVAVRWYESGGEAIIEVIDTGVGIPEKDLGRIFERFYRVDKARSRELGGTGLGLAIVKHLTQALGGTVSVASTPGQGSTFTLRLPAVADGIDAKSHKILGKKDLHSIAGNRQNPSNIN